MHVHTERSMYVPKKDDRTKSNLTILLCTFVVVFEWNLE
jgi:hypothetical protein